MKDLAFAYISATGNYDLVFEGGILDPTFVEGTDEIDQRLLRRLRLMKEEWFLDRTAGVPYYQEILAIKGVSMATVEQAFRAEIRKDPDVISIDLFQMSLDKTTREVTISIEATTADGTVIITNEVL